MVKSLNKSKAGSRNSKPAAFEEIDFSIYTDKDKTFSFFTHENSLALWITSITNYYEHLKDKVDDYNVDITWTQNQHQRKLAAQVKECQFNKDGAINDQITISLYLSTSRILIQGNKSKQWCTDIFPQIREMVQCSREKDQIPDIEPLISQLLNTDIEETAISDHDEEQSKQSAPTTSFDSTKTPVKQCRTPRRLLPTPPTEKNSISSLVNAIKRLEEENLNLKEKLHDVSIQNEKLNTNLSQQKQLIQCLQNDAKEISQKFSTLNKNSFAIELEIIQKDVKKEIDQINRKFNDFITKQSEELYARMRQVEDVTAEIKNTTSRQNNLNTTCTEKIEILENSMKNLMEEVDKMQEKRFDGIPAKPVKSANQTKDRREQNQNTPQINRPTGSSQRQVANTSNNHENIFKDMKGRALIFGDSNTKGLDPSRMKLRIGSLSGARIESAIKHLESKETIDVVPEIVVYHLGTNDLKDNVDNIKSGIDKLMKLVSEKYPKATVGICQIPRTGNNDESSTKIEQLNTYMYEKIPNHYISNDISESDFMNDRLHYNKRGLASLARNIKSWIKNQGFIPRSTRKSDQERQSNIYDHQRNAMMSTYQDRNDTNHSDNWRYNSRFDNSSRYDSRYDNSSRYDSRYDNPSRYDDQMRHENYHENYFQRHNSRAFNNYYR